MELLFQGKYLNHSKQNWRDSVSSNLVLSELYTPQYHQRLAHALFFRVSSSAAREHILGLFFNAMVGT